MHIFYEYIWKSVYSHAQLGTEDINITSFTKDLAFA